jgi:hypothetical protein
MKKLLFAAALTITAPAHALTVQVCTGEFALCAASPTTPVPGKTITVGGKVFPLGVAVCPVLRGPALADMDLMNHSCAAPGKNQVWSLFQPRDSFPQAPTWANTPAAFRKFTTTTAPGGGMSNMFSFPCTVRAHKVNGTALADCHGPMNESPTGVAVPAGTEVMTQSPAGAADPVGGPTP